MVSARDVALASQTELHKQEMRKLLNAAREKEQQAAATAAAATHRAPKARDESPLEPVSEADETVG